MKKSLQFVIIILLIISAASLQQLSAQDKTKEDKEKEMRIQQQIEEQKRAMADQKRAQEEALQSLQKAQEDLDNSLEDINVEVEVNDSENADQAVRAHVKRINRDFRFDEPYVFTPGIEPFYVHSFEGDGESTTWEFSRKVKEKTLKSEYTFDVEKTFFYDAESVVVPSKSPEWEIVKVCTKENFTSKGVMRAVKEFGKKFEIFILERHLKTLVTLHMSHMSKKH